MISALHYPFLTHTQHWGMWIVPLCAPAALLRLYFVKRRRADSIENASNNATKRPTCKVEIQRLGQYDKPSTCHVYTWYILILGVYLCDALKCNISSVCYWEVMWRGLPVSKTERIRRESRSEAARRLGGRPASLLLKRFDRNFDVHIQRLGKFWSMVAASTFLLQ